MFLTFAPAIRANILTSAQDFFVFTQPIKKIELNSKILCPQSPSILVPRLRRLRDEKRAMGTRMGWRTTRSVPGTSYMEARLLRDVLFWQQQPLTLIVFFKFAVMYQSIPKPPIPPRAIPGHLTRVNLRTVENLPQNEARPVGHLTFVSKCLSIQQVIWMLCRVALWTQMVKQRINSEV